MLERYPAEAADELALPASVEAYLGCDDVFLHATLRASRICSGAMYAGVPIVTPLRVRCRLLPSSASALASPKSVTLGT
jgi:hypothetical protein